MSTFLERLLELKGDVSDAEFARRVGVKYTTMKNYLSGRSMPPIDVAAQIADVHAKSLDWLYGRNMVSLARSVVLPDGLSRAVHVDAIRIIGHLVSTLHRDRKIRLSGEALSDEIARHFDALMSKMDDPSDLAELHSLVLWIENRIKKELAEAEQSPGTGKREAS